MNGKAFLLHVKKRLLPDLFSQRDFQKLLRLYGVHVGENCLFYNVKIDLRFGKLISIGNNCTLTNVVILAHDASTKRGIGFTKIAKTIIGNNVFAGVNSVILPGTTIGDFSVIGAGTIVSKNVPPHSVVCGNPMKILCSYEDFISKNKERICYHLYDKKAEELSNADISEILANDSFFFIR